MATISLVNPREVPSVWPVCLPMLRKAIARSQGRYNEATVFKDCLAGNYTLWLIMEGRPIGTLITQIITWPTGLREGAFVLAGGEDYTAWLPLMGQIEKWAAHNGCQIMNASGRPGWEKSIGKLPGWTKAAVEMEKRLA